MTQVKPVLQTSTGEFCQFVRIYYQVFNQKTVLGAFKNLRCMDFDAGRNRWVWLFEHEAKKLRLNKTYNQVPKNQRPIIIGSFSFRGKDQMLLDVRSCERATKAIEFFDKRINRRAAKVDYLRVLNKLFEATQENAQKLIQVAPDSLFEQQEISRPADLLMEAMDKIQVEHEDLEARQQAAMAWIEEHSQLSTPELEEMPTHFYEDGIEGLELSFQLRQLELLKRWSGDDEVSILNIIQDVVNRESFGKDLDF